MAKMKVNNLLRYKFLSKETFQYYRNNIRLYNVSSQKQIVLYDPENFRKYFEDFESLKKNIFKRKCLYNAEEAVEIFKAYDSILETKNLLEEKKIIQAQKMKEITTNKNSMNKNETFENLKEEGRVIRNSLKQIMTEKSGYKNTKEVLVSLLSSLPAPLHPLTPPQDKLIFQTIHDKEQKSLSHVEMFKSDIELRSINYEANKIIQVAYLSNNIANLQRSLYGNINKKINKSEKFKQVIVNDLVRSLVRDASGYPNEGMSILNERNKNGNKILAGNSLLSHIALIGSLDLSDVTWPLNFSCLASNYKSHVDNMYGLYDLTQTMQLDLVSVSDGGNPAGQGVEEGQEAEREMNFFIQETLNQLSLSYKIVEVGWEGLAAVEGRKILYFLWSPAFNKYFQFGSICNYGEFLGRRLNLKCPRSGNFLNIVHGSALKLPSLLAGLLEQKQNIETVERLVGGLARDPQQMEGRGVRI